MRFAVILQAGWWARNGAEMQTITTLLVIVVTAVYVFFTGRILQAQRRSTIASEQQAAAARDQAAIAAQELQHMQNALRIERKELRQSEHERAERALRAQAELVSGWYGGLAQERDREGKPRRDWLVLLNRSHEPVYQAVATLVFIQGTGPKTGEIWAEVEERGRLEGNFIESYRSTMWVIPPGEWRTQVSGEWGHLSAQPAVELAFTDRRGHHWIRRSSGELEGIATNGVDHYHLVRPRAFETPTPYRSNRE